MMYARAVDNTFARDVRAGLMRAGQKTLPCRYFYDDLGSSLFEAITNLPEYGLTRADERILQRHAAAIVERLPRNLVVAELGSGTGTKTRGPLSHVLGLTIAGPLELRAGVSRCTGASSRQQAQRTR